MPRTPSTADSSCGSLGELLRAGQPLVGALASAGLDVDEAEHPAGLRGELRQAGRCCAPARAWCRTAAPSSSRPRAPWTRAVPSATRASAGAAGRGRRRPRARRGAGTRGPASTAPAEMAALPASSWASAAARPTRALPVRPTFASAAERRPGDGSAPSSLRNSAVARSTWSSAAARWPAVARAAHEQGLEVLVERVEPDQPAGRRDGVAVPTGRELGQRGLVQQCLGRGGEPAALDEQPRLEGRAPVERHPLQQLAAQVEALQLGPVHVDAPRSRATSTVTPSPSTSRTGSPVTSTYGRSDRRTSARLHRSAPSGSSASGNSSVARRCRVGGRSRGAGTRAGPRPCGRAGQVPSHRRPRSTARRAAGPHQTVIPREAYASGDGRARGHGLTARSDRWCCRGRTCARSRPPRRARGGRSDLSRP